MAAQDRFERNWYNVRWTPDEPEYDYLFSDILVIGTAETNQMMTEISWNDKQGIQHNYLFSPPLPGQPTVSVHGAFSSSSAARPFTLTLTLEKTRLTGTIDQDQDQDWGGPVGTFIADANPVGDEDEQPGRKGHRGHRKSPGWRRWLRRLVRRLDKSLAEERIAA